MQIILLIILILLLPTVYAAIIGAPILNTSKKRIKQIIEITDIKNDDVIYELGAGTGKMAMAFSKNPGVKTVGFELSPIFYSVILIKKWLFKRKNLSVRMKNFYKANLSEANIVYFYLMPRSIEKLKSKLEKNLKPGTKIISFAFPIKNWEPYKTIQGDGLPAVYFYRK